MGTTAKFVAVIASGWFDDESFSFSPSFFIHVDAFDIFCDEHVLFLQWG